MSEARQSVRTAVLAAAVVAAVAAAIQFNGLELADRVVAIDGESIYWVSLVLQVGTFLVGTVGAGAIGYRLADGTNPKREFVPFGVALFGGALVGFCVGALGPELLFESGLPSSSSAPLLRTVAALPMLAAEFALAGLAGLGAAVFLGDRD